jgi:hypothetical protein
MARRNPQSVGIDHQFDGRENLRSSCSNGCDEVIYVYAGLTGTTTNCVVRLIVPSCSALGVPRTGTVDCLSTGAAVEGSAVAVALFFLTRQFAQNQMKHSDSARLVQWVIRVAAFG